MGVMHHVSQQLDLLAMLASLNLQSITEDKTVIMMNIFSPVFVHDLLVKMVKLTHFSATYYASKSKYSLN